MGGWDIWKYSIFELQSDGENTQSDLQSYKPTYLPDGAELKNTVEQPEMLAYEYAINESGYFNILLSQSDTRIYADAENTEIESFDKGGVIGYYFKKDDWIIFAMSGMAISFLYMALLIWTNW